MLKKLLYQGAEAKIFLDEEKKFITKNRIKKSYRIPELDNKIRKSRTKSEIKLLQKAGELINIPKITTENNSAPQKNRLKINKKSTNYSEQLTKITLEYIKGKKLSEHLDELKLKKQKEICRQIGKDIAKLHDANIIHGDLTTSNMILAEDLNKSKAGKNKFDENKDVNKKISKNSTLITNNKSRERSEPTLGGEGGNKPFIFFIDFGLGFISHKIEDKAVDLHLLKQALEAKHYKNWHELWEVVELGYKLSKNSKIVLERLKAVEKRGRYK